MENSFKDKWLFIAAIALTAAGATMMIISIILNTIN